MQEREDSHVADAAAVIIAADQGRQKPEAPLPKGWAGLVERDRRARRESFPNPAGDPISILLHPWRLYILIASLVLIPVLVVLSVIRETSALRAFHSRLLRRGEL